MADFPTERVARLDPRERSSVVVHRALIGASATLQPCAAVALCGEEGLGLGAVSVYLERAQGTGAVPAVTWQLRGRHGGTSQSEPINTASGALGAFTAWTSEGSVVHVSGRRYLGFELWAQCAGGVSIPCNVRFVVAPASAGCALYVEDGELV